MKQPIVPPTILLIFGITGDLARTKLLPALYELEKTGHLPEHLFIFGTSRQDIDTATIAQRLKGTIKVDQKRAWSRLLGRIRTIRFDINEPSDYARLHTALESFEQSKGLAFNLLLYLAIPPDLTMSVVEQLAAGRLNRSISPQAECRLLIEKPFGTDLSSAKRLVKSLQRSFKEKQIYRIDHYLAKETVQNILTMRSANPWLKALWSGRHIKAIDIWAFEQIGAEGRSTFYEQTGALRDVIQSHLLQLLAVTTMHIPSDVNEVTIAKARQELLKSIKPLRLRARRATLRGQYKSYRREVKNSHSHIETFASIPIRIDQASWRRTRIRLVTGKALAKKETRIAVTFSEPSSTEHQNVLTFRIQPEEGIGITLVTRQPGFGNETDLVALNYSYPDHIRFRDAYESVLWSAMRGDRTLFLTSDEVLTCWRIIQPLLKRWRKNDKGLVSYKAGASATDVLKS